MDASDVELVTKDTGYDGYFRIDRYRLRHRTFAGGMTETMMREVFERGHAAAVVLFDPLLDLLVLIEQFRIGIYAAAAAPEVPEPLSPWLLETVAGIIDHGESPEDVVRRESLEEAGCQVQELEEACLLFASPGASTETVRIFCGRVDASQAGGLHGLAHEHEDIRVAVMSPADAFRRLDEGHVLNATAMVALHWFRQNHERIRAAWTTADTARS